MKLSTFFLALGVLASIFSCKKDKASKENQESSTIVYKTINKEYVILQDVAQLQQETDEVSMYIDSILSGLINTTIISTGQKQFDLDSTGGFDIAFEIIDLKPYNNGTLPTGFDSLAARVLPQTVEVLDNSTYGYPDALNTGTLISSSGNWSNRSSLVLGTFLSAGQFKGKGERYLGIRFMDNGDYKYGWVKLYCSQANDTLRVIDYAYNTALNSSIDAGQVQ